MLDSGRCRRIPGHGLCCCRLGPAGYRGFRRRAGHGGSLPVQRRPKNARVVPRAPRRSPTRCKTGTPPRFHRYCAGFCSRARVGSATAPRDDGSGIAGELAAPHIQSEARKLKLTLKTDACLRPGSVPRQAPGRPRSMGRGTCPENSRGVRIVGGFAKSQTQARGGAPIGIGARRRWRPPGSPSPAASRRARSSPPRASGPSCSTSVAAFVLKTRLRSRPLKTPRGHRAAPGLPSGPFPGPREALPRIWGAGAAPPPRHTSDIRRLLRKVEKAGNAPPTSSPGPHTLI
jgi:hypothetical protein